MEPTSTDASDDVTKLGAKITFHVSGFTGEIAKPRILLLKIHFYRIGCAVAVLCDAELGDIGVLCVLVVVVLTIEEHVDIRILLDGAGFAQVREHGTFIRPSFGGT